MQLIEDVTFRQGSGKWLICNQTGERVARSKTRKSRIAISRRLSGYERPAKPKPVEVRQIEPHWKRLRTVRIKRLWDEAECPHCYYDVQKVFFPKEIKCPRCQNLFQAV